MRVLIQAGHVGAQPPSGAPGESVWTAALAAELVARLRVAGVETAVVGDWLDRAPPAEVYQDAALLVALHYDAAIYGTGRNSGCFADRAVDETQAAAADHFIQLWESLYPAATGIALHNERRNARTNQYYAFRALTWATPGVLLEHGCGAPVGTGGYPPGEDAVFLHAQLKTVAELDAQAILAFLDPQAASDPAPQEAPLMTTDNDRALLELAHALDEANAIKQQFEWQLRNLEGRVYRRERRTSRFGRPYWAYVRALPPGSVAALIAAGRGE